MDWLRTHKFQAHLAVFLLMVIPPSAMFLAIENGATTWVWGFLGVVILGNLLVLFIR